MMSSLFLAVLSFAPPPAGRTWDDVQYLGGAPGVRVDGKQPEQYLTIAPDSVRVNELVSSEHRVSGVSEIRRTMGALLVEIPRASLLSVTYQPFRRENRAARNAIGIPGVRPMSTDHLFILGYRLPGGREAEILLRVHKKDYAAIQAALQSLLPQPVAEARQ